MGGTFNPVHNGHIRAAEAAAEQFGLDKVLFITGGNPPHKRKQHILSAELRHKMVQLAIAGYDKFEAYDYEVKKQTYSYTFETLKHIKQEFKDAEIYFIIGADSFHNIPGWYKPRTIMELCTLLVYERTGFDREADLEKIKKEYFCKVEFINSPPIDVSSSEIRELSAQKKDISEFLPCAVHSFITRNNLYSNIKINVQNPNSITFVKTVIQGKLTPERFKHSLGVCKTASILAEFHEADLTKVRIAALLHDCAKNLSDEEMKQKCEDYDIELDEHEKKNPFLIHAKVGEKIAEYEFGIHDAEILEAIKWHTLGMVGMGLIAKIVFVADMVEPLRHFNGIAELRTLARKDIDKAVAACIESTIYFNNARKREVHPNAYEVYKWVTGNEYKA